LLMFRLDGRKCTFLSLGWGMTEYLCTLATNGSTVQALNDRSQYGALVEW
jgi:hypothetical protein